MMSKSNAEATTCMIVVTQNSLRNGHPDIVLWKITMPIHPVNAPTTAVYVL